MSNSVERKIVYPYFWQCLESEEDTSRSLLPRNVFRIIYCAIRYPSLFYQVVRPLEEKQCTFMLFFLHSVEIKCGEEIGPGFGVGFRDTR